MLNRAPDRHAPYVGESAFATKAGIHASAILKEPATYEHVPPDKVGNRRKLLVSDQGGKSNVLAELERIGLKVEGRSRLVRLLDEVKEREASAMPTKRRTPLRTACPTRARTGAAVFRRRKIRRHGRAARQCARRAGDGLRWQS